MIELEWLYLNKRVVLSGEYMMDRRYYAILMRVYKRDGQVVHSEYKIMERDWKERGVNEEWLARNLVRQVLAYDASLRAPVEPDRPLYLLDRPSVGRIELAVDEPVKFDPSLYFSDWKDYVPTKP